MLDSRAPAAKTEELDSKSPLQTYNGKNGPKRSCPPVTRRAAAFCRQPHVELPAFHPVDALKARSRHTLLFGKMRRVLNATLVVTGGRRL
ncbi:hypothetical protein GDO78_022856 [Eleutherodactylus coqui]|uniref:Uncharacterized protein n=1 Tax=Eleutherodactylus coqui TaxID=57060 RepID=A0A8J6EFZ7_ELECQ|nr:hypothetical protein GDO78_022856 [Eleutherodactylus coqui]